MAAAGAFPAPDAHVAVTVNTSFYNAFVAITNPVFAYAGHFMFFILISEMRRPQDAMKAAWTLQIFATTFYAVFAVVMYVYLGPKVASPAFSSLPPKWAKATYGIALANFLIAGSLYSHTASKLFFIRLFRKSVHLHEHTVLGWGVWTILIIIMNGAAFVLAVGVPIFPYLVGIAASLFASWYTYGLAVSLLTLFGSTRICISCRACADLLGTPFLFVLLLTLVYDRAHFGSTTHTTTKAATAHGPNDLS